MNTSAISSALGPTPQPAQNESSAVLSANFDTFLTLLTAQLQNQDPLDPVDSAQFTEQLVQYSQVEQQIQTNDTLKGLVASQAALTNQAAISYLDRSIVVNSPTSAVIGEDQAVWIYELPPGAVRTELTIRDSAGRVVGRFNGETSPGVHRVEWDGKIGDRQFADGNYTLEVQSFDQGGAALTTKVRTSETVMSIETGPDGVRLITKGGERLMEDVLSVQ